MSERYRILVTGSRNWTDEKAVTDYLDHYDVPVEVVHGDCPTGLDNIVKRWAMRTPSARQVAMPADWKTQGRKAGPLRNQRMVNSGYFDVCLAWPKGESRGTRDCMRRALEAGIPVVNRGDVA